MTDKFPVLSYGATPHADVKIWTFEIIGLVENPVSLSWDQFLKRTNAAVTADFHCVTGWSRFDNRWEGALARDLLDMAVPRAEATHIMVHCYGGYTTNIPLDALLAEDVHIAHRHNGEP